MTKLQDKLYPADDKVGVSSEAPLIAPDIIASLENSSVALTFEGPQNILGRILSQKEAAILKKESGFNEHPFRGVQLKGWDQVIGKVLSVSATSLLLEAKSVRAVAIVDGFTTGPEEKVRSFSEYDKKLVSSWMSIDPIVIQFSLADSRLVEISPAK